MWTEADIVMLWARAVVVFLFLYLAGLLIFGLVSNIGIMHIIPSIIISALVFIFLFYPTFWLAFNKNKKNSVKNVKK